MQNECFVLSRDGIHFSAKSGPRNKIDAYGTLYISTLRMVFVNEKAGSDNRGFDIPLATLYKESFNQPIFGANNMTGLSPPLDLPEGADHWKWCISFRNGGVGTFLPFFFRLLQEMRRRMQEASAPTAQPTQVSTTRPPHPPLRAPTLDSIPNHPRRSSLCAEGVDCPCGAGGAGGCRARFRAVCLCGSERPHEVLHPAGAALKAMRYGGVCVPYVTAAMG